MVNVRGVGNVQGGQAQAIAVTGLQIIHLVQLAEGSCDASVKWRPKPLLIPVIIRFAVSYIQSFKGKSGREVGGKGNILLRFQCGKPFGEGCFYVVVGI